MQPPLTTDVIKSERMTTRANDSQSEREGNNLKLKNENRGWRKYCCGN